VNDSEKSDRLIVPEKPSNKGPSIWGFLDQGLAEMVEGRGLTKGNLVEADEFCTQ